MIPAGSLPAAIAGAAAIALLVPGRPGPRRLVTRQGLFSDRWSLLAKLRGKDVLPATCRLHRGVAVIAAVALLLLFGLPLGLLPAVVAFFGVPIGLSRFEPAAIRQRSARVVADLPLAVDLLAACLRAGRPPAEAVGTVGKA